IMMHPDLYLKWIHLLRNKAKIHENLQDFPGALRIIDMSLASGDDLRQKFPSGDILDTLASLHFFLGRLHMIRDDPEPSWVQFDKAQTLLDELQKKEPHRDLDHAFFSVSMGLANTLTQSMKFREALLTYDRIIDREERAIFQKDCQDRKDQLAMALFNKGNTLFMLKQPEKALLYVDKAIEYVTSLVNPLEQYKYESRLGMMYMNKAIILKMAQNFAECLDCSNMAINIYTNRIVSHATDKDNELLINCYRIKSVALDELGRREEALKTIEDTLAKYKKLVYEHGRMDLITDFVVSLRNQAVIYYKLGKIDESIDVYHHAVAHLKDRLRDALNIVLVRELIETSLEMAVIFENIDNYSMALEIYETIHRETLSFPDNIRNELSTEIIIIQTSIAIACIRTGNTQTGLPLARQSKQRLEEIIDTVRGYKNIESLLEELNEVMASVEVSGGQTSTSTANGGEY
ncbi:hypothetical protein JW979_13155, partial [bacterium]|nr:hypothetical protein [candidate division CSSED10-310 bacterium]